MSKGRKTLRLNAKATNVVKAMFNKVTGRISGMRKAWVVNQNQKCSPLSLRLGGWGRLGVVVVVSEGLPKREEVSRRVDWAMEEDKAAVLEKRGSAGRDGEVDGRA